MRARPIVVQKFGGTSVADPESRSKLVDRVRERRSEDRDIVVVVSAMGRSGEPYATDSILSLLDGLDAAVSETDRAVACGEILSAVIVASTLSASGIPARSLSGAEAGILTDDRHGEANVLHVDPALILDSISAGIVPVVAGFQGMAPDGSLTTLGRGGSDTTACALAVALDAESVEILTDVEGLMTADPRVLPEAEMLDVADCSEAFQMARHGSRVVHPSAARTAMEGGVPVLIRSTFSGAPGTLLTDAEGIASRGIRKVATAVSHVDDITRFTASLPPDDEEGGHMGALTDLFAKMAEADVSLDMFTPCGDVLVFSVSAQDAGTTIARMDGLALPYAIETELAKVTLVGAGMHGVPGVMARLAAALRDAGVTIKQIADSHTTISVLICQNDRSAAVEALHRAFDLGGSGIDPAS